jgi:hypothetical protein
MGVGAAIALAGVLLTTHIPSDRTIWHIFLDKVFWTGLVIVLGAITGATVGSEPRFGASIGATAGGVVILILLVTDIESVFFRALVGIVTGVVSGAIAGLAGNRLINKDT